jgi:hypothetical protein
MVSGSVGHGRQRRLVTRGGVGVHWGGGSHLAEEAGIRDRPEVGQGTEPDRVVADGVGVGRARTTA